MAFLGTLAAFAAVEHGIGEILQGFGPPDAVQSWPDSPAFASLSGESAMTVVPSLGVSGMLTVLSAAALAVYAVGYAHRPHGGLVLSGISVLLLQVGGGFGPPLIGILLGLAAMRAAAPGRPPGRLRQRLSRSWRPLLGSTVLAYLGLFPGTVVLYWLTGVNSAALVMVLVAFAFGGFALTMIAMLARDRLNA